MPVLKDLLEGHMRNQLLLAALACCLFSTLAIAQSFQPIPTQSGIQQQKQKLQPKPSEACVNEESICSVVCENTMRGGTPTPQTCAVSGVHGGGGNCFSDQELRKQLDQCCQGNPKGLSNPAVSYSCRPASQLCEGEVNKAIDDLAKAVPSDLSL